MLISSFINIFIVNILFTNKLLFLSSLPLSLSEPCVKFLIRLGEDLGMRVQVECPVTTTKPIVILSQLGTQPELKSIILNSHMDVVPVYEEYWTHKPFDAEMDGDGKIFARGAQDMKSVGMQYLGALRYFKRKQITFKRTIHVMFVPEEELGGDGGMADFIHTEEFRSLNAAFSLDEGKIVKLLYRLTFPCFTDVLFINFSVSYQALLLLLTLSIFITLNDVYGTSFSRSMAHLDMDLCY